MIANEMRIYTDEQDPHNLLRPLEQFLKKQNIKALMEVLTDPHEIGTHGATTRSILLSSRIKNNIELQEELATALLGFDLASLKKYEHIREMMSFGYFSLSEDKKGKDTQKHMTPLRAKRMQDFRDGKFSSLPRSTQGMILIEASYSANALTESEIDDLTELKKVEHGSYRSSLMFRCNTHKALDFIAGKGNGDELTRSIIILGMGKGAKEIDAINYVLEKYPHLLNTENTDTLIKWRGYAEGKKEKKSE